MGKSLVIEDDESWRKIFQGWIQGTGHKAICPENIQDAENILLKGGFRIVLLGDVTKPEVLSRCPWIQDKNGENISKSYIRYILSLGLETHYHSPVYFIIITKLGFPAEARYAIQKNVIDYIQLPYGNQSSEKEELIENTKKRLLSCIKYVFNYVDKLEGNVELGLTKIQIIGDSLPLKFCLNQVLLISKQSTSVLITGETGSGKELVANAIHENSGRTGKFIPVNCAAITESLAESILFGIETKVATGVNKRLGEIEKANGGTLFLDEIGDLPPLMQSLLLRALQEKKIKRVGGEDEINFDFRLICATNLDLAKMVKQEKFRNDLLYRLQAYTIRVPALRERKGDVEKIATHFIDKLCAQYGYGTKKKVSQEFIEALKSYEWPGNVRELKNILETSLSNAYQDDTLDLWHLPEEIKTRGIINQYGINKEGNADAEHYLNLAAKSLRKRFHTDEDITHIKEPFCQIDESTETDNELNEEKISENSVSKGITHRIKMLETLTIDEIENWVDYNNKIQKEYLEKLMELTNKDASEVAKKYGVTLNSIYTVLSKHGISKKTNYKKQQEI